MPDDAAHDRTPRERAAAAILNGGDTAVLTLCEGLISYANPLAASLLGHPELQGMALRSVAPELAAVSQDAALDAEVVIPSETQRRTFHVWVRRPEEAPDPVLLFRDISPIRDREVRLRERTRLFEAIVASLPFDFWVNDLENRTVLQNSFSRRLWGEQYGVHMSEVQSDPVVLEQWRTSNELALSGQVSVGEIVYHLQGEPRSFRNIVGPIHDGPEIIGIFGLNIDITDLKQALSDRELLLQELNHRVKNHLQMIISLVQLQQSRQANDDLRRLEERVHAIYHVHDQLHEDQSLETIDLQEYFDRLVSGLTAGYDRELQRRITGPTTRISYQRAVSFGIVTTELLVNACKHGAAGESIQVQLSLESDRIELQVHNRLKQPPGSSEGGLALIHHVAGQLAGTLEHSATRTHYTARLRFPVEPLEKKRTMG